MDLYKALQDLYAEKEKLERAFKKLQLSPQIRAEKLSLGEFVQLTEELLS